MVSNKRVFSGVPRDSRLDATTQALTENIDILTGVKGDKNRALLYSDLVNFDAIKLLAFNAEEYLLEQFSPYYQGKDVRQALLQIIFRGTVVQLVEGVLHVRLKSFDSPKIQAAAEALCIKLNAEKVVTLDKFQFPIVYEVLLSL